MLNHASARRFWIAFSTAAGAVAAAFAVQACSSPGQGGDVVGPGPVGPSGVLTYHNDLSRDGDYTAETQLTPANVVPTTFGKLAGLPVDGVVYAQPLVARGVAIPAGSKTLHDLVIVATEHASVYAFDAQTLSPTPIWRNNFVGNVMGALGRVDVTAACSDCSTLTGEDTGAPNVSPAGTASIAAGNTTGVEVGITSTPVIDATTGVIYVTSASKEGGNVHIKLHAIDITTGLDLADAADIQGSVPGTGLGSNAGVLAFDPSTQLSRAGLVLSNGTIFVGMSTHNDQEPAHGWMFAYDSTSLAQTGVFVTTPNSALGSIWQAGQAPAVDASGSLYFATGNGDPNSLNNADFDDSVVKLGYEPSTGLALQDWFTPYNRLILAQDDLDMGSGGVLLLPDQAGAHPHLLVSCGKEGTVRLIDRDSLGHTASATGAGDTNIVQVLNRVLSAETPNSFNTGVFAPPVYWNGQVYYSPVQSTLRAFSLSNGRLSKAPVDHANEVVQLRGGGLSVSANQNANAIVWLLDPSAYTYGFNMATSSATTVTNGPAVLYAYDAEDLSAPLYRSDSQGADDYAGNAVKFAIPTIAGGHVYVGTQSEVSVYGNIPTRTVMPQNPANPLPALLSETGFFSNLAALTPADGVMPYDVETPFWSDGSGKDRFIILPQGQKIIFSPTGSWTFPVGTRLLKQFDFDVGNGVNVRLETRVLTLQAGTGGNAPTWVGATYQWAFDQSDAHLLKASATATIDITNNGTVTHQTWYFPSPTDCVSCHNPVAGGPLGVRTRQLNHANPNVGATYPGSVANELDYWNSLKLFTADIGAASQYDSYVPPTSSNTTAVARSYLAVNCAICHTPGGTAGVGIDFSYDTPEDQMGIVNAAPTKGNQGVPNSFLVTPGSAAKSVVYLRMDTAGTGRMPPLASLQVDPTGTTAIAAWIDAMTTPPADSSHAINMKRPRR